MVKKIVAVAFIALIALLGAVSPAGAQEDEEKPAATEHTGGLGVFGQDSFNTCRDNLSKANIATVGEDAAQNDGLGGGITNALRNVECFALSPVINAAADGVEAVSKFWDTNVGEFVQSVMEGSAETMMWAMTFWMDYSMTGIGGASLSANVEGVRNIVLGLTGLALIASFIVGGARLAASRRMGLQEGITESGEVVGRWLIFSLIVPGAVPGALIASDLLADAIMDNFGVSDPETFVQLTLLDESFGGPILLLILSLLTLAGSIMQLLALVIRVLILPIAAGLTPLFAALSFSETGRSGLNHLVAYIIAAIAFKPVSALLYSVVLWNVTNSGDGSLTAGLINALMIGIAGFTAPALIRAIVPAVAQAGGSGAAGAMTAAGALGAGAGALAGGAGRMLGGAGAAGRAASSAGGGSAGGAGVGCGGSAGGASTSTPPRSPVGGGSRGSGGSGDGGAGGTRRGSARVGSAGSARPLGAGASRAGRSSARVARSGARGAASVAKGSGYALQGAGSLAQTTQNTLEGSIGGAGHYAGQIHR